MNANSLVSVLALSMSATALAATGSFTGFPARSLVCDNAHQHFELNLATAQPNGQKREGQPVYRQHVAWALTAKDAATELQLGQFYLPTSTTAQSIVYSGSQTGWFSPSLGEVAGNWAWVPQASDVYQNEGVVNPQSHELFLVLENQTRLPVDQGAVLRMTHPGTQVQLSITAGDEARHIVQTFEFSDSDCQSYL